MPGCKPGERRGGRKKGSLLAPYVHPKLQATEHFGPEGGPMKSEVTVTLDETSLLAIENLVK